MNTERRKLLPEVKKFIGQLYCIDKTIVSMAKNGFWYCNPSQCEATFKCQYRDICYYPDVLDKVLAGELVPEGFKKKGK